MQLIGYSTGALAKDQVDEGVALARKLSLKAVELSALRHWELSHLMEFINSSDLRDFEYVSVHAPTDFVSADEAAIASALAKIANSRHWPVVLHPDSAYDLQEWKQLGPWLLIENMDERKRIGRSLEELEAVFASLPEARFCFDIAHARQVDSSMTEAFRILSHLAERTVQMHFSEVGGDSRHIPMSASSFRAYISVASLLPSAVPVVLESPCDLATAGLEISRVRDLLNLRDSLCLDRSRREHRRTTQVRRQHTLG
jgi:hypothetical protein